MTRLARDPSGEPQEQGRQLCRFVGRGGPPHATFRRIDRRRDQNVAQGRTSRAAARSNSVGPRRNRESPARNQSISDLPNRPKDELRRAAGATKSVANLPAARPRIFFFSALDDRPKSAYSLARTVSLARAARGTGGSRLDGCSGSSSCIRRTRRNPAQFRAGVIREIIPGGNAMVVVEFVSLIHHGKCRLCRRSPSKPILPPME
jgi:hypothetical protein